MWSDETSIQYSFEALERRLGLKKLVDGSQPIRSLRAQPLPFALAPVSHLTRQHVGQFNKFLIPR